MNRRKFLIGTTSIGAVMAIGAKFGISKLSPLTGGKWSMEFDGVFVGPFDIDQAAPVTIPSRRKFAVRVFLPSTSAGSLNSRQVRMLDREFESPTVTDLIEWPWLIERLNEARSLI